MKELCVPTALERPTITSLGQPYCTPPGMPTIDVPDGEIYAPWFKALADTTRIYILNGLARSEESVYGCDLTDHFPLGQPTSSHHLNALRDVRSVAAERRGAVMYHKVHESCLAALPEVARRMLNT
jgi:DNA-binding transcriptional ArsR family regulator